MTDAGASDQWREHQPEADEGLAGTDPEAAAKRAQDAARAMFATQPDVINVDVEPIAPDYMPAPPPIVEDSTTEGTRE